MKTSRIYISVILLLAAQAAGQAQNFCLECNGNSAGEKATALGSGCAAIGNYSLAVGYNNQAQGLSSISLGQNNISSGHHAVTIGRNCFANPRSYAIGDHVTASGNPSVAIGHYVEALSSYSMVIGSSYGNSPLVNNIPSSLMVGFESSFPTLFVGPTEVGDMFGRVGVGTKNPGTTLDVNGGVRCQEFALSNQNVHEGYVLTCDAFGKGNWAPANASLWTLGHNLEDIYRLEGKVGIGIANPLSKLQITEKWTFNVASDEVNSIGYNGLNKNDGFYRIKPGPGAFLSFEPSGALSIQHFGSGNAGDAVIPLESVIFDNNGNVGINTRLPEARLDVNGKIRTKELQLLSGTFDEGFVLRCSIDGTAYWSNPDELNDGDWNQNDNILWVADNELIGIGTNNPEEALHVKNNMMVNGDIKGGREHWNPLAIYASGNAENGAYMTLASNYDNTGSIKLFSKGNNGRIELHTDNGQVLSVRADNTIMVGNPDMMVDFYVNGDIEANKVRVSTDTWWDDVFNPDYKLMPVPQVEEFVRNHHHLPGFPNEEEVMKNGIDVGEMNALLVRKVEELTLYVIWQQKEIEELKTRLKE